MAFQNYFSRTFCLHLVFLARVTLGQDLFVFKCTGSEILSALRYMSFANRTQVQAFCKEPPVTCVDKEGMLVPGAAFNIDCSESRSCLDNEFINGFSRGALWCCKVPEPCLISLSRASSGAASGSTGAPQPAESAASTVRRASESGAETNFGDSRTYTLQAGSAVIFNPVLHKNEKGERVWQLSLLRQLDQLSDRHKRDAVASAVQAAAPRIVGGPNGPVNPFANAPVNPVNPSLAVQAAPRIVGGPNGPVNPFANAPLPAALPANPPLVNPVATAGGAPRIVGGPNGPVNPFANAPNPAPVPAANPAAVNPGATGGAPRIVGGSNGPVNPFANAPNPAPIPAANPVNPVASAGGAPRIVGGPNGPVNPFANAPNPTVPAPAVKPVPSPANPGLAVQGAPRIVGGPNGPVNPFANAPNPAPVPANPAPVNPGATAGVAPRIVGGPNGPVNPFANAPNPAVPAPAVKPVSNSANPGLAVQGAPRIVGPGVVNPFASDFKPAVPATKPPTYKLTVTHVEGVKISNPYPAQVTDPMGLIGLTALTALACVFQDDCSANAATQCDNLRSSTYKGLSCGGSSCCQALSGFQCIGSIGAVCNSGVIGATCTQGSDCASKQCTNGACEKCAVPGRLCTASVAGGFCCGTCVELEKCNGFSFGACC